MKTKTSLLILLVVAGLLLAAGTAYAQATVFTLSWWTVDSGGGDLSGTGYTLSGTTGQPDAGTLSGSGYSLAGGFWGGGIPNIIEQLKLYLPLMKRP